MTPASKEGIIFSLGGNPEERASNAGSKRCFLKGSQTFNTGKKKRGQLKFGKQKVNLLYQIGGKRMGVFVGGLWVDVSNLNSTNLENLDFTGTRGVLASARTGRFERTPFGHLYLKDRDRKNV